MKYKPINLYSSKGTSIMVNAWLANTEFVNLNKTTGKQNKFLQIFKNIKHLKNN